MNSVNLRSEELFGAFASWLAELADRSSRRDFHMAIPGGSTPEALFSFLAGPGGDLLPWDRLHFWWTDERLVPAADPRSNFGRAESLLLSPRSIPGGNIHRIRGELEPRQAVELYSAELERVVPARAALPVFDLVLLGLGEDGHTASLFPGVGHDAVFPTLAPPPGSARPVSVVAAVHDGLDRVSLSMQTLLAASELAFLVMGEKKASVVSRVLKPGDSVDEELPASVLFRSRPELVWFTDLAIEPFLEDEE